LYNISGATYEIISIPENKLNPRENKKVIEGLKQGEYLLCAESEKEMRKHCHLGLEKIKFSEKYIYNMKGYINP
jgi:hypothetical protein